MVNVCVCVCVYVHKIIGTKNHFKIHDTNQKILSKSTLPRPTIKMILFSLHYFSYILRYLRSVYIAFCNFNSIKYKYAYIKILTLFFVVDYIDICV